MPRQIEMLRRLVQQDDSRLLREDHRDDDALAFAAAERLERSIAEGRRARGREGRIDGVAIGRRQSAEPGQVSCPAAFDQVAHRETERQRDVLRDHAEMRRERCP